MYYPEQLCNNYIKQLIRSTSFQMFVSRSKENDSLLMEKWVSEAFKTFKYKFVLWVTLKPCFLKKHFVILLILL